MQLSFKSLEKSLRGQPRMQACPLDVYAWFVNITAWEDELSALSADERTISYQTWTLAFQWIVSARTEKDIIDFCELECRCSPANRSLDHARAEKNCRNMAQANAFSHLKPIGPSWMLMVMFTMLFTKVCDEEDPEPHLSTLRRIRKRTHWPRSIQDLLPYGPEDTLQGLLQWFTASPHQPVTRQLYAVYTTLIQFCHPLVIPRIVVDFRFVQHIIIEPIHHLMSMFTAQPVPGPDVMYQRCQEAAKFIELFCPLLRCFRWGRLSPAELTALNGHFPQGLFDAYVYAIHLCDGLVQQMAYFNNEYANKLPTLRYDILKRAVAVVWEFERSLAFQRNDEVHQKLVSHALRAKDGKEPGWSTWEKLLMVLTWLDPGENQMCLSPFCHKTLADSRLKQCLGCARVHYCSRTCQKQAWKHSAVPHRVICHVLAALCQDYNIPATGLSSYELTSSNPGERMESGGQFVLKHFTTLSGLKLQIFTKETGKTARAL